MKGITIYMKKNIIILLFALLPMLAWAQEPYAVLSEDNTVLTFYYDNQKSSRGGMSVGPFTYVNNDNGRNYGRGWEEYAREIRTVEFDASFANCTSITSTAFWFIDCYHLQSIIGIENLNTSNVTDMTAMFNDCNRLTSLDLSHFDTSKVTNMGTMFTMCLNLELYQDFRWILHWVSCS